MKTIGIYIGRFQPPHRGNYNIYKKLKQITGSETYIATDDAVEFPDNPLSLGEKEQIFVRHGIPANRVVKVVNIFKPDEIIDRNNPDTTNVIIAVDQKHEAKFLARKGKDETGKEIWLDTTGKPSHYQPYKGNEDNINPSKTNVYILFFKVEIDGRPISGENIRHGLTSPHYTDEARRKFFLWAFGWYDVGLYQLITERFKTSKEFNKPATPNVQTNQPNVMPLRQPPDQRAIAAENIQFHTQAALKERIKPIIKRLVQEYMTSFPSATPQGETGATDTMQEPGATERRMDSLQARQDAQRKKAAEIRTLSTMKADVNWKEKDLKRKKRDELPAQQKKIDTLNKTISSGGKDTSSANLTEIQFKNIPDPISYNIPYKGYKPIPPTNPTLPSYAAKHDYTDVSLEDIPDIFSFDRPTKDTIDKAMRVAAGTHREPIDLEKRRRDDEKERKRNLRRANYISKKAKEEPLGIWAKLKKAYKDTMEKARRDQEEHMRSFDKKEDT